MGTKKVTGWGYNAEAFDAATGMINLRARQYEPALNRFSNKDIYPSDLMVTLSINQYIFTYNNPINNFDANGFVANPISKLISSISNWWNSAKKTAVGRIVDAMIVKPVVNTVRKVASTVASVAKPILKSAAEKAAKTHQTQAFSMLTSILERLDNSGVYYNEKMKAIVEEMQKKISMLDFKDVSYQKQVTKIVEYYCGLYSNYDKYKLSYESAMAKISALNELGSDSSEWRTRGRDIFRELYKNRMSFSPEIANLLKFYADEVFYRGKTTLLNVSLDNNVREDYKRQLQKFLDAFSKYTNDFRIPEKNKQEYTDNPIDTHESSGPVENLFGGVISSKEDWDKYHGTATQITEQAWRDYLAMLIDLNNRGNIEYGSKYPYNNEEYSSLSYNKGMLYIDCWGLIKTGAKVILTNDKMKALNLNGSVNNIYQKLEHKGIVEQKKLEALDVPEGSKAKLTYPNLETGMSIFIDNQKERLNSEGKAIFVGYDHVMTYVENFVYKDANGKEIKIAHALVGIGEPGVGLQIYDFDEKYQLWTDNGIQFRFGNQLNIIND